MKVKKNHPTQVRKASTFLSYHCLPVFKLFFASSTMLWAHMIQTYHTVSLAFLD